MGHKLDRSFLIYGLFYFFVYVSLLIGYSLVENPQITEVLFEDPVYIGSMLGWAAILLYSPKLLSKQFKVDRKTQQQYAALFLVAYVLVFRLFDGPRDVTKLGFGLCNAEVTNVVGKHVWENILDFQLKATKTNLSRASESWKRSCRMSYVKHELDRARSWSYCKAVKAKSKFACAEALEQELSTPKGLHALESTFFLYIKLKIKSDAGEYGSNDIVYAKMDAVLKHFRRMNDDANRMRFYTAKDTAHGMDPLAYRTQLYEWESRLKAEIAQEEVVNGLLTHLPHEYGKVSERSLKFNADIRAEIEKLRRDPDRRNAKALLASLKRGPKSEAFVVIAGTAPDAPTGSSMEEIASSDSNGAMSDSAVAAESAAASKMSRSTASDRAIDIPSSPTSPAESAAPLESTVREPPIVVAPTTSTATNLKGAADEALGKLLIEVPCLGGLSSLGGADGESYRCPSNAYMYKTYGGRVISVSEFIYKEKPCGANSLAQHAGVAGEAIKTSKEGFFIHDPIPAANAVHINVHQCTLGERVYVDSIIFSLFQKSIFFGERRLLETSLALIRENLTEAIFQKMPTIEFWKFMEFYRQLAQDTLKSAANKKILKPEGRTPADDGVVSQFFDGVFDQPQLRKLYDRQVQARTGF